MTDKQENSEQQPQPQQQIPTSKTEQFLSESGPSGEQPADNMVPFEEKPYMNDDGVHMSKGIFVDGTLFDWGVDEENYKQALALGPQYRAAIEASIAQHFIASLSEFMGHEMTLEEVEEARKTGWIRKPKRWI